MSITLRRAALKTSWIAIAGTVLLTWLGVSLWLFGNWIITDAGGSESLPDVLQAIFVSLPGGLLTYGLFIWAMVSVSIIALDLLLFRSPVESIRTRLLIEWGVLCMAFIGWAVVSSVWAFLIPVVPLLLAQLYREKRMRGMLAERVIGDDTVLA